MTKTEETIGMGEEATAAEFLRLLFQLSEENKEGDEYQTTVFLQRVVKENEIVDITWGARVLKVESLGFGKPN